MIGAGNSALHKGDGCKTVPADAPEAGMWYELHRLQLIYNINNG